MELSDSCSALQASWSFERSLLLEMLEYSDPGPVVKSCEFLEKNTATKRGEG